MKVVLIGAGQRGRIYADYIIEKGLGTIVAVAEPNAARRKAVGEELGIREDLCFQTDGELWELGKIANAAIIASLDRDHYAQVMRALEIGYDILLEKPISPNPKECREIQRKANELGRKIVVCHVLRYTPFFSTLKKILDSGELGRIVSIQHNENIGNFHMAHSFVRGNWRCQESASSLIMQKSCHDMDILTWLIGSKAKTIASFGNLSYFKEENAPEGSSDRCCTCIVRDTCRFSAYKAYMPVRGEWPATVLSEGQSGEQLEKAIVEGAYGRCVYRCDNDVCDHQVTIIEYENQVTVSFNLSAFTNKMCRTIKIMCEEGEIRGSDGENRIEITHFASNQKDAIEQEVIYPAITQGGHGGGDTGIAEDFVEFMNGCTNDSRSSIDQSVESHYMSCAAEKSRLTGEVIYMRDFLESL